MRRSLRLQVEGAEDREDSPSQSLSPSSSLSDGQDTTSTTTSACTSDDDDGAENDLPPFDLRSDLNADMKKWKEKIRYSSRYQTKEAEYRHVILPKTFYETMVHHRFKDRLLSESEWRHIGIVQSLGWEHYLIHAPEPHIFLFRRELEELPPPQCSKRSSKAVLQPSRHSLSNNNTRRIQGAPQSKKLKPSTTNNNQKDIKQSLENHRPQDKRQYSTKNFHQESTGGRRRRRTSASINEVNKVENRRRSLRLSADCHRK